MFRKQIEKIGKKGMVLIAAVFISVTATSIRAEAAMGGGWSVAANGAVDSITVNGVTVEALYKERTNGYDTDDTYCCAAFVKRFYSQVYGRNVYNLNSTTSVPLIDSGSFQETNTPKIGDILRDNESVHWAIVKEVNGDTVTLIQQNAWNSTYTKAWVGATANLSDPRYTYFTWSGNTDIAQTQTVLHTFSFGYHSLEKSDTNAVIHTKVNNPERVHVQKVGCYIYDENGEVINRHEEDCSRSESQFNIWYDFNNELGITLTPGTTYAYQFYLIYDGVEYGGHKESFTTTGEVPEQDTGMISDKVKNELSAICGKAPSLEHGEDGLTILTEMVGASEEVAKDNLDESEKVKDGVNYYPAEYCGVFDTEAPVALEMENGRIKSLTWKYTYADSSDKAGSEKFYNGLAEIGDKIFNVGGVGMCERKDQMITTWEDKAQLEWEITNEVPSITLTIVSR